MIYDIVVLNPSETTFFAAQELASGLRQMATPVTSFRVRAGTEPTTNGISLALADDLRIKGRIAVIPCSTSEDAVAVDIRHGQGVITGANERSILIGVYRFLHHLGCRWVRPGAEGEFIPSLEVSQMTATFEEKASLKSRVLCIEGAVSLENVLEIIDWAPKVGFSGFFMQFPDGYTFFNRWYSHANNTSRSAEPFGKPAARAFTLRIESEIQKRRLEYHAVGHGWTCRALGVDVSHWNPISVPLTDETRSMLALVGGQRALRWDRPMLTSLCFSQPEVRRRMNQAIVDYATGHPEVDLLHVWVDDGGLNKCECEACARTLPADEYVKMLHELDAALTVAGSSMRIVFIGYSDLLWAPKKGTPPLNPGRFAFLYANARSDYAQALSADGPAEVPDFVRNQGMDLNTPERFRGFLKGWQEFSPSGDQMLFEYYGCGPMNQFDLARVIHKDAVEIKRLGFTGLINCQSMRVFFPTGLPCYVLGQVLWNNEQDLDTLRDDYFLASFGQDGGACKEFIKVADETLNRIVQFTERMVITPEAPAQLAKLSGMIAEFERVLAHNAGVSDPCQARSWFYMNWYTKMLKELVGLYRVAGTGTPAAVLDKWQDVRAFLMTVELSCQPVFDFASFVGSLDRYLIEGRFINAPQAVVQP